MSQASKTGSRVRLALSLAAAGTLAWILVGQQSNLDAAQQSTFMGGSPRMANSEDVRTLRLVFPAGVRSNWHTHSWGQLLMVEEGRGLTQVRGGPVLEARPGEPWFTAAGVEHWHGAAVDEDALQMTIYEGTVEWLEPVSDEAYRVTPQR
ncbi:MAG: cupin domain-containing protein [Gemmatimonadetes bacterium]|nr:cupin domain-containing protein [Gemmatimonadota bacterium]MCH8812574.1 cupin domain-containing protein [Gemmatimonadota bacterium]